MRIGRPRPREAGTRRPRPLDPRLLRYASAARGGLALTVAAGLAGTGLILAQAGLLARVLAGAATGTGIAALATPLIALAAVLAARSALSYGGEAAALRAAALVKSQLRRRLLDHAFRLTPGTRSPGAGHPGPAGRRRARSRPGPARSWPPWPPAAWTGWTPTSPGTCPSYVLACLVPVAVLIRVTMADWLSGVIIAVTLPLVPRVCRSRRPADPGPHPAAVGGCWPGSAAISWTWSRACPRCAYSAAAALRKPPSPTSPASTAAPPWARCASRSCPRSSSSSRRAWPRR